MSANPYQIVTERIVALLEQGIVPWRKPWHNTGQPRSLASGKGYRGVNVFLLSCEAHLAGYMSPYWLTFKQCSERGGRIRKGERGNPVVFWKKWEVEEAADDGTTEKKAVPVLRYFTVFNADQCEGLDVPAVNVPLIDFQPLARCEEVVARMPSPPAIQHRGQRACYSPARDTVEMPKPELFVSGEEYYSTLFHELAHATGHASRLDRKEIQTHSGFGSEPYAREELVAEMGAAFLCAHCRIEANTLENSAAYIEGWLGKLRSDTRLVVQAASQGQRAVDYILGTTALIEEHTPEGTLATTEVSA